MFLVTDDHGPVRFYSHTRTDADIGYCFVPLADGIPVTTASVYADRRSV